LVAIHAELAYAGWLTQRLAETRDQARVFLQQRLDKGRQIMSEIKAKHAVTLSVLQQAHAKASRILRHLWQETSLFLIIAE